MRADQITAVLFAVIISAVCITVAMLFPAVMPVALLFMGFMLFLLVAVAI